MSSDNENDKSLIGAFFVVGCAILVAGIFTYLNPPIPCEWAVHPQPQQQGSGPQSEGNAGPPASISNSRKDGNGRQNQYCSSLSEWWLVLFTGALACIGVAQIFVFIWQLRLIRRTADISHKTAESGILAQRAYIRCSPNKIDAAPATISIVMEFKNFGKTPAKLTDIFIDGEVYKISDPWPPIPPRMVSSKIVGMDILLMPDDHVLMPKDISIDQTIDVNIALKVHYKIMAFGYVDYIDAFKGRHRSTFVRHCILPTQTHPDGRFEIISACNFNYDRQRTPSEGLDWNDDGTSPKKS